MAMAYIALGSNLDSEHRDRAQTLTAASVQLEEWGQVVARSSLYETEPVGFQEQGAFLNAAIALHTALAPALLLQQLLRIERRLGRDRSRAVANGPRTLDLDLLLLDDRVVADEGLSLPHPAMAQRRFVLAPLAEIAPQVRHPLLGLTMAELLVRLADEGENRMAAVRRLPAQSVWPWPDACG